ncbi:sensor histidine kinase [Paenibacillus sp. GCM10012307]|uniref:histidine kinase n=1 Tax=Paenibacillus roseus TaxID=2798579 RepID=A0A934J9L6_9BACL|nr:ATP-binding protein [Paenibacillus roseus]MBJ6364083.1 hypothetical protein [Paenibacillus roseus]
MNDSGIGIPQSEQEHIFERFYQIANGSGKKEGSGLGLVISREIVHVHHGSIRVESDQGSGSDFQVTLPLRFEPANQNHASEGVHN